MLISEFLAFLSRYLSFKLKVVFITNQQNDHLRVGIVSHIVEPSYQVVEGLSPSDIINQECTYAASVITSGYRSKRLLPGSVPNLDLDTGAIIEFDRLRAKVYTDSEVMRVLESVVYKL